MSLLGSSRAHHGAPCRRSCRTRASISAHASYTALNGLTKDLVKGNDDVLWRLRVLAVMLSMDVWHGLAVQFALAADKEARAGAPWGAPACGHRNHHHDSDAIMIRRGDSGALSFFRGNVPVSW